MAGMDSASEDRVNQLRILVVELSDSFSDLWRQLGDDLDVGVTWCDESDLRSTQSDIAAVLLAAGGAEQKVLAWLDRHDTPIEIPTFAVGSDPGRRTATQIAARGVSDYFALPEDIELLRNALGAAVERRHEAIRRSASRRDEAKTKAFSEIIGDSIALKEVLSRAARLLPHHDATVLLIGATGTGKELLAQAIHDGGARRGSPFVPVNCSALPDHLIESELFGHERGAFTDAHSSKPGLFEVADGGTLFLDEIGTLPVNLQAKLLRVLQDKQIRRIGGTRTRKVDVRIIAAANEDLNQAIRDGRFREDLYYRLVVITLTLPKLCDRGQDVILIADALLERLAKQHRVPVPALSAEVRRVLLGYHWPGNVRELKNAVERALLLSPKGQLDFHELLPQADLSRQSPGPIPFPAQLDQITTAAAHATVELCSGNRSAAARRLGISRRRLRRLLDGELLTA